VAAHIGDEDSQMNSIVSIIAFVAAAAPAQPKPFDLVCEGVNQRQEAETIRYRIDLSAKRWCYDKCEETSDMKSASASELVLEDGFARPGIERMTKINRETGSVVFAYRGANLRLSFVGTCAPAPFSGFPAAKF
jgi:hypothetical protein